MHMTFYWSRSVTLLIDSWKTDSWTSYGLTLLACLIVSAFYQYLEDKRIRLNLIATSGGASPGSGSPMEEPLLRAKLGRWRAARFAGAAMFGINSAIGYLIMLAVMSFNGGVFIAVVVGLAIGYLLFKCGDDVVAVVDNACACA